MGDWANSYFSARLLASCGYSIIPADDNNQFPHWVKQYDFLDWAEDWKSRTLCPNLILPMICSLTLGKEFHFSFLIYKMRIMILSLYPHRAGSSVIVHKEWQIFAMCNVWVLYYSISTIKSPCRPMRDTSRIMFSTLCARIAAKHSGYQTNLMERKMLLIQGEGILRLETVYLIWLQKAYLWIFKTMPKAILITLPVRLPRNLS